MAGMLVEEKAVAVQGKIFDVKHFKQSCNRYGTKGTYLDNKLSVFSCHPPFNFVETLRLS